MQDILKFSQSTQVSTPVIKSFDKKNDKERKCQINGKKMKIVWRSCLMCKIVFTGNASYFHHKEFDIIISMKYL